MLSTKYPNIRGEMDRDKSLELCRKKITTHINVSQLKLFFSEMMFLNLYSKKGDTVVYVGAAPGFHMGKLADLYPDCHFELWDVRDYDFIPRRNISVNKFYFTDKDARKYRENSKGYLFMCDLSDNDIVEPLKTHDIDGLSVSVDKDMYAQFKWCRLMKPRAAFLKFKLSYRNPPTYYFGGNIILQPFSKLNNESRIVVTDYTNLVEYNSAEYDKKMAYHNAINRCRKYSDSSWTDFLNKHNFYPGWDTIIALGIVLDYVDKTNRTEKTKYELQIVAVDIFLEILMYHRDKYWNTSVGAEIDKIYGYHPTGEELENIVKTRRWGRRQA